MLYLNKIIPTYIFDYMSGIVDGNSATLHWFATFTIQLTNINKIIMYITKIGELPANLTFMFLK